MLFYSENKQGLNNQYYLRKFTQNVTPVLVSGSGPLFPLGNFVCNAARQMRYDRGDVNPLNPLC